MSSVFDAIRSGVTEQVMPSESQDLPGGVYACTVTKATCKLSKKGSAMIQLVWDVVAGPYKGYFADPYYADKDFRHDEYVMLEGGGEAYQIHKLNQLQRCNPRVDVAKVAEAAYQVIDKMRGIQGATVPVKELDGCNIAFVLRQRLYTYGGKDRSEVSVAEWLTGEEARAMRRADGSIVKVPEPLDERDEKQAAPKPAAMVAAPAGSTVYDDEIPF